jgi:beta-glucosidase
MQQEKKAIYLDPSRSIDERVSDLLAQMTLEEKVAQLGSAWIYEVLDHVTFSEAKAAAVFKDGIGQITRLGGASSLAPVGCAEVANTIQAYLIKNTRLGIPAIVHEECCSGLMAHSATCFPQIIGTASTWNPTLVEEMGKVIRTQMRAVGAHQGLSPVLDVARDPRWGRVEETFGEDPYLISELGNAYAQGLQGKDLRTGVIATAKHFLAYAVSEGGMNWAPAHVPLRELYEVFLLPFEAAIRAGNIASVMNAYHELDGIPVAGSREIMTDLLRDKLGFDGIVVSDYFAVNMLKEYHHIARDKGEAAAMALEAGIDIELPSTDCYGSPLMEAIKTGQVTEDLIDTVVGRALQMKFTLGLFENPYVDTGKVLEVFDNADQRQLARQIAQESMILLKNERNLLPLKKDIGTIAVIGPNANEVRNLVGDYAYPAHIETLMEMRSRNNVFNTPLPDSVELAENFVPIISVLEAIKGKVSAGSKVLYAQGCEVNTPSCDGFAEAVEIARKADVVIAVVGDKSGLTDSCTSGEARDRAELNLPGVQDQLVEALHATGKPTVVVLVNGRPLAIPWIDTHIPAIVEAWMPGEEGANAIADVLFGDYNPGGKVPMTFPRAVGQIPIYYGHKPSGGRSHWKQDYVEQSTKPLYPFGYGLSYTQFEYSNLRITPEKVGIDDRASISVDVSNVGGRSGDEIVQLYIHGPSSTMTRPLKELKGFKRITLAPGQKCTVTFHLSPRQLGFHDRQMAFVVEPGTVEVMIGASSADIRLRGTFEIPGQAVEIGMNKVYFCEVNVR